LVSTGEFVGESDIAREILDLVDTAAGTDTNIMICGEPGTGKELIARALHQRSRRRPFPFVPTHCGGLTDDPLESALFGHERGAFTEAQYRRKGNLELADGGTVFLDEVGHLSDRIQEDLLHVLETGEFNRLGGDRPVSVDVRIICATHDDLEQTMREGRFREHLYYKLNVFSIHVPPLRERRSDIPLLARHFLCKYARVICKSVADFEPEALQCLESYGWPGNVRELENAIERAVVITTANKVRPSDLPELDRMSNSGHALTMEAVECQHMARVLEHTGGNVTRAAGILGINRVTLYNKIRKYHLR